MNARRFAMAPFRAFMAYAMNTGSATGVAREPQLVWAVALGALSYSALVTLAIGSRARSSLTIGAGIKIGAVVGFLLWFTADFTFHVKRQHGRREGIVRRIVADRKVG